MKIIIGLGNPGKKYEFTRHNMGFITVEYLADKYNIKVEKLKFRSLIGEGVIEGEKVILVKPQTFMNLSGEAVREIVNFYKTSIDDVILIYDDIDTETGFIRIRKFGSAGTHNGMKSVIFQLKTDRFPRVRIGIGKPGIIPLMNYVTGKISSSETKLLKRAVEDAGDAIVSMMVEDIDMAMNKFNKKKTDE
ncbi:MAG: aminoacyl-tRNA hydrolase [Peptostreptococcaceae bacterium]|nr:aminoacyl-tRNA hydrolase [Peptostreptococcaceae bacterium]